MIYPELLQNKAYLKTKYWRLYILLKKLCQFFLASKLSDYQVNQQTELLHEYLSLRLSLIDEDDISPISPKHIFATFYDQKIRSVGCLSTLHTNRYESKNGQHKV